MYSESQEKIMFSQTERREATRLPFTIEAICRIKTERKKENQGSAAYGGAVRDVSMVGMFILSAQKPAVNRSCTLSFSLIGEHSTLEIRDIKATVVRRDDDGFVVEFNHRLEWFALVPIYFSRLKE
jgi:hypothetical protein